MVIGIMLAKLASRSRTARQVLVSHRDLRIAIQSTREQYMFANCSRAIWESLNTEEQDENRFPHLNIHNPSFPVRFLK